MDNANTFISAGALLKKSWQIYKARAIIFIALAVLPSLVSLLFYLLEDSSLYAGALYALFLILAVVAFIISFWMQIAIIYMVKERERKISVKEALSKAWRKILSYIWVSILSSLAVLGGLILLIIPGIIFAVWFSLSSCVLVAEDLKGTEALKRSKQLVKGRFKSVLWRLLIVGVFTVVISLIFNLASEVTNFTFIEYLPTLFTGPFVAIFTFLIYEDLKKLGSSL